MTTATGDKHRHANENDKQKQMLFIVFFALFQVAYGQNTLTLLSTSTVNEANGKFFRDIFVAGGGKLYQIDSTGNIATTTTTFSSLGSSVEVYSSIDDFQYVFGSSQGSLMLSTRLVNYGPTHFSSSPFVFKTLPTVSGVLASDISIDFKYNVLVFTYGQDVFTFDITSASSPIFKSSITIPSTMPVKIGGPGSISVSKFLVCIAPSYADDNQPCRLYCSALTNSLALSPFFTVSSSLQTNCMFRTVKIYDDYIVSGVNQISGSTTPTTATNINCLFVWDRSSYALVRAIASSAINSKITSFFRTSSYLVYGENGNGKIYALSWANIALGVPLLLGTKAGVTGFNFVGTKLYVQSDSGNVALYALTLGGVSVNQDLTDQAHYGEFQPVLTGTVSTSAITSQTNVTLGTNLFSVTDPASNVTFAYTLKSLPEFLSARQYYYGMYILSMYAGYSFDLASSRAVVSLNSGSSIYAGAKQLIISISNGHGSTLDYNYTVTRNDPDFVIGVGSVQPQTRSTRDYTTDYTGSVNNAIGLLYFFYYFGTAIAIVIIVVVVLICCCIIACIVLCCRKSSSRTVIVQQPYGMQQTQPYGVQPAPYGMQQQAPPGYGYGSSQQMVSPAYSKGPTSPSEPMLNELSRPLTLAEKILYSHLSRDGSVSSTSDIVRGDTYLKVKPDRVAMQDASALMALLQFMLCGRSSTVVPTTVHCDHLIQAYRGSELDLKRSLVEEREIYEFLEGACKRYGIGFWKPGSGIIHQIVFENYATPGTVMLGTDSHTPNAGGLGMLAIGVGGADAVDAMADIPWELNAPKVYGIELVGQLNGWSSPKDVILTIASMLSVRGGTGFILEYFGPGVKTLSCTGMATICNMGAEVGATTSVFPYTNNMDRYLCATNREHVAKAASQVNSAENFLSACKGAHYDKHLTIDLSKIEPHLNGPFTPDAGIPISKLKQHAITNKWPTKISAGLIGSCTNSSYEDLSKAASITKQALNSNPDFKTTIPFFVTPGSEVIRATIERDGQTKILSEVGAQVLANACGPCIGQWKRDKSDDENVILSSFNRNFRGRNDGNTKTMNFLASPEIVTALTIAGDLSFNPLTDSLDLGNGKSMRFQAPVVEDLPTTGYEPGRAEFLAPSATPESNIDEPLVIDPKSDRLQSLKPFEPWNKQELKDLLVLVKVRGKCTTDHISAAGPWLKYKGHLENISNNTLIGAMNDIDGRVNVALNQLNSGGEMKEASIPDMARYYQKHDKPWMIVADYNYGEGSAREHAALQPRYLGGCLILAKSFARIHETNLKKQGVLPLTFENADDYDKIPASGVKVSTEGLVDLVNGNDGRGKLKLKLEFEDGSTEFIPVKHSMSKDQLSWFAHGSALNMIKSQLSQ